ncbi:MAG: hypothetical protein A3K83_07405 [Omnitrophica WOR_2 bacterium RBG_13_44_8b]|nr:MAG: hypothetical protein A3K83_07405 [Omnitrophica WOR_2 bacterium RBG_13_44_8b]
MAKGLNRDIGFLCLAVILSVFLNACYVSGLYYEHDVPFYAYSTLKFYKVFGYLISKGFFHFPLGNILLGLRQTSEYSISGILPPGINFIFLAAFFIFGKSFIGIQIFSLIANLSSVILLYLLAKHILGKEIRLYFLLPVFYALFNVCEAIQGHTSNAETFLSTFEIASILFIGLAAVKKKDVFYLLGGFLSGLGFFVKQSAFATFAAGLVFIFAAKLIYKEPLRFFLKKIFYFTGSFLAPLLLLSAYLLYAGMWGIFIKNPLLLASRYITNVNLMRNSYLSWSSLKAWQMLKFEIIIFGSLALTGIVYAVTQYRKPERLLALIWFAVPTLIISRFGFHFRHHFIEILASFLTLSIMGLSDILNLAKTLFERKMIFLKISIGFAVFILAFPFFHLMTPLIKQNKPANSFFLTERYLRSRDRAKFTTLLIRESADAARRFLVSVYIKEHTAKYDEIFVWDDLGGDSIYLWSGRDTALFFSTKSYFLPGELRGTPFRAVFYNREINYKYMQETLLGRLMDKPPVYIVVVRAALPVPNAPFTALEMVNLEKRAFKGFFDFLDKNYRLDKDIMGCLAYRRVTEPAE